VRECEGLLSAEEVVDHSSIEEGAPHAEAHV
jgi:hypothetical protein